MRFIPALLILGTTVGAYVFQHAESTKKALLTSWITTDDDADAGDQAGHVNSDVDAGGVNGEVELGDPQSTTNQSKMPHSTLPGGRSKVSVDADDVPSGGDFSEVFRFDLTPRDISQRWSRVSSALSDHNLRGFRVSLVTGTEATDLAGSLTYFFDAQSRLRRIAFLGTAGDPRRIVDVATRQFAFRRVSTRDSRRMTFAGRNPYRGQLQIAPAAARGNKTATNYQVTLTIDR